MEHTVSSMGDWGTRRDWRWMPERAVNRAFMDHDINQIPRQLESVYILNELWWAISRRLLTIILNRLWRSISDPLELRAEVVYG